MFKKASTMCNSTDKISRWLCGTRRSFETREPPTTSDYRLPSNKKPARPAHLNGPRNGDGVPVSPEVLIGYGSVPARKIDEELRRDRSDCRPTKNRRDQPTLMVPETGMECQSRRSSSSVTEVYLPGKSMRNSGETDRTAVQQKTGETSPP